jgi:reactive intermediate/imine deaminase
MARNAIHTEDAPAAIGTYSQAVSAGNLVFLSGQIPLDPQTQELVARETEPAVRRVFENIRSIAQAAGGDLGNVAKLTIYLTDLGDFGVVNEVMSDIFDEPYPARAVIQVSALPKGTNVEIDAILSL